MKKHPIRVTVSVRKDGKVIVRSRNGVATTTKRIRAK